MSFAYDDENQLTQVWVPTQWFSQFTYDGRMRRRIRQEYTWSGGWVQTNIVYYVYDGNVVIQERDINHLATVTYTRGKDLTGSLEGAGGIGGLLARTDNSAGQTAFYHADGNGNVTMLVNPYQAVVAKYLYDAFGNTLSLSGPIAYANLYRFSSKEAHQNSGLVYYLYRYYDPNLQRWLNRDPMGESGGLNVYNLVGNNPVNRIDKYGTTWLYSNKPFPGMQGMYGPLFLEYIDDGSTQLKQLRGLSPNELFRAEIFTYRELRNKSTWCSLNPYDESHFDTGYFEGMDADDRQYYLYNGSVYADNELNYFGIGMYENWAGDYYWEAEMITRAWKFTQYGQTPNPNVYYWLRKGYYDYQTILDPSLPLPK